MPPRAQRNPTPGQITRSVGINLFPTRTSGLPLRGGAFKKETFFACTHLIPSPPLTRSHTHRHTNSFRGSCPSSLRSIGGFWCCLPGRWRRTAETASLCPESPESVIHGNHWHCYVHCLENMSLAAISKIQLCIFVVQLLSINPFSCFVFRYSAYSGRLTQKSGQLSERLI